MLRLQSENVTKLVNHVRVTLGEYTVTTALNLDLRSSKNGIESIGISRKSEIWKIRMSECPTVRRVRMSDVFPFSRTSRVSGVFQTNRLASADHTSTANTPCATHPAESASPSLSCELIPSLTF